MAWEAPHLLPLVLLVLLASGSWEQQPPLRRLEGEEVFVRCYYPLQRGSVTKTWCRLTSAGTCTTLVTYPRLGREPGNSRYVIRDHPREGYFTVIMTALRETDSGLYLCRIVNYFETIDLKTIRLAVSRASTSPTTRTTRTTAWIFPTSPATDSPAGHWNVTLSVMAVLLLLLALALLVVILYFLSKARQRQQRRRARAGEGKAHHIHGISTHEDETVHRMDPPARQRDSQLSWGSDQQLGSGKDTGDIHYASFTHLDPFGLEDLIYVNTRPGLRPTPDSFLAVEYASITKN